MSAPAIIAVAPAPVAPPPAPGRQAGATDAAGFEGMVEAEVAAADADEAEETVETADPAHQAGDDLAESMLAVLMMPAPPAQAPEGGKAGSEITAGPGAAALPSFLVAAEETAALAEAASPQPASEQPATTVTSTAEGAAVLAIALETLGAQAGGEAEAKPTAEPPKDRIRKGAQTMSAEAPKTDAAPRATGAPTASPTDPAAGAAPQTDANAVDALAAGPAPQLEAAGPDTAQGPIETRAADAAAAAQDQVQVAAVRGAPETVASLAAKIVKKLDERSSRFDLELDPVGLGRVDVRVEINAQGRMTAAMSFDTPQAAAELRARAGELQRALEQSGFDLSGGMTFDVAGQGGRSQQGEQQQADTGAAFRGRAFRAALDTAAGADAAITSRLNLRSARVSGVDIRI